MPITNREAIFVKTETTYGTDAVPTGADAVQVSEISPSPNEGARIYERNIVKSTLGKLQPLYGGSLFALEFTVELKSGAALGTAPEYGRLLEACGSLETIVASTSVAYSPLSSGIESVSIYYYMDGIVFKLVGCRGNFSLSGAVGEPLKIQFRMVGRLAEDPSDASTLSPTYDTNKPQLFSALNCFTVNAYNPAISEFSMDLGNTVATPPDANSDDGYGQVRVAGRDPRGSFNPEMTLIADQDWLDDWRTSTQRALSLVLGATTDKYTLSLPQVSYLEPGFDDRDGIRALPLGFKADETTAGDDEYTLTFAA